VMAVCENRSTGRSDVPHLHDRIFYRRASPTASRLPYKEMISEGSFFISESWNVKADTQIFAPGVYKNACVTADFRCGDAQRPSHIQLALPYHPPCDVHSAHPNLGCVPFSTCTLDKGVKASAGPSESLTTAL
jgi:hypothetical protein